MDKVNDAVQHPAHYTMYKEHEVIELTRWMPFDVGNTMKYIVRAPFKEKQSQDLKKSLWYARDFLNFYEETVCVFTPKRECALRNIMEFFAEKIKLSGIPHADDYAKIFRGLYFMTVGQAAYKYPVLEAIEAIEGKNYE